MRIGHGWINSLSQLRSPTSHQRNLLRYIHRKDSERLPERPHPRGRHVSRTRRCRMHTISREMFAAHSAHVDACDSSISARKRLCSCTDSCCRTAPCAIAHWPQEACEFAFHGPPPRRRGVSVSAGVCPGNAAVRDDRRSHEHAHAWVRGTQSMQNVVYTPCCGAHSLTWPVWLEDQLC